MDTSCEQCIFAVRQGNEQVGCKFNRIEKFENAGTEIVGIDNGENKYFLIKDRFCNACRDSDWGKRHPKRKWREIVENEFKIQVDIIVVASPQDSLGTILDTVDNAYNQTLPPKEVIIICSPEMAADVVGRMTLENRGSWRVETTSFKDVVPTCKSTYYAVFQAGYEIHKEFISSINKYINIDMRRFVTLLPDTHNNGFVNGLVSLTRLGSDINKIYEMAVETNSQHMIKYYDNITNL